jgi:hypothetical protein
MTSDFATETDAYQFDKNEIEFAAAAIAMMEQGYTPARCRWLVTCALLNFQHAAKIQARREALRIVGDVPPGDGAVKAELIGPDQRRKAP